MNNKDRILRLREQRVLPEEDFETLLATMDPDDEQFLYQNAREVREQIYGKEVYLRGIIEFSSFCRNDCYYCGIRKSNRKARRYHLTKEQILSCVEDGYRLDFRTFVLQSGEDLSYSEQDICDIVSSIRSRHPDCAVTLSIGEKTKEEYQAYFDVGAQRYLLREETADPAHYARLHPAELSLAHRLQCLWDLREIGYQVGCGIMVGSPYQTWQNVITDLLFMRDLQPQMIGIGPFIHHSDTPFRFEKDGTLEDTLHLLGVLRLMFPSSLLPATTALGTIHPHGREMGILAGANVVMPNLSPREVRTGYMLYDGKICTGDEAAECRACMARRIASTGYHVVVSRGDHPDFREKDIM